MMKRKLISSILLLGLMPTVGLAQAVIPAMTVPSVKVDFESMALGPTDVAAINAAHPGANLGRIEAIEPLSFLGNYSVGFSLGRALALDPSGNGGLFIVDPWEDFGGGNGYAITLGTVSTEIGLSIADYVSTKSVEFYLGATQVGTGTVTGNVMTFYELPSGFDRVHVVGTPNYVIPEIWVQTGPAQCYADCDQSTGAGVLDIFDFLCFQDSFVAGDPYACDCDTSTGAGVCDVFDFLCFQDAFVSGCP